LNLRSSGAPIALISPKGNPAQDRDQRLRGVPLSRFAATGVINMRGDPVVIEYLNRALRSELAAINQYWLHYRLLDNWGYKALAMI
jgi:hypothetical protein